MKAGREYRPYRFHAFTYMLHHGLVITEDHYDLVYTSHLYPGDDPDIIWKRINEKRPRRFQDHSVSRVTSLPSTRRASPNVIIWKRRDSSDCRVLFSHHPNRRNLILKKQRVQVPVGDERIITLRTTDYLLKGRKGLWLEEDMILVDDWPFFLLRHQDFGNDAAFVVVDEYGNQVTYDSYDGFYRRRDPADPAIPTERKGTEGTAGSRTRQR